MIVGTLSIITIRIGIMSFVQLYTIQYYSILYCITSNIHIYIFNFLYFSFFPLFQLATALSLLCHCLATALSLPRHCLVTTLPLPCPCFVTALPLPFHCIVTTLSLPCHCLPTALSLPCHCIATAICTKNIDGNESLLCSIMNVLTEMFSL